MKTLLHTHCRFANSSYFVKYLYLALFAIACVSVSDFNSNPVYAETITDSIENRTITGGAIFEPNGGSEITIGGTNSSSGEILFKPGKVTLLEGATLTSSNNGGVTDFQFGSDVTISGTMTINNSAKVRTGVGGDGSLTSYLTITPTGNLTINATSGDFYFCNGGPTATAGTDALYKQVVNVDGGTFTGTSKATMSLGVRNNLEMNIINGGTASFSSVGEFYICGMYADWGGRENKTATFNIQNGTLSLNASQNIQLGVTDSDTFTRKISFVIGENGTLETNRRLVFGNNGSSKITATIANNGGTFYMKDNDVWTDWHMGFSITGDAKFKVDNKLTVDNNVTGAGNLIKQGAGTLVLQKCNSYTGNTYVEEGTLAMNASWGNTVSSRAFNVSPGATLEILQKNATGWGFHAPDLTLQGATEGKDGGKLVMNITADTWSSVGALTMGDGASVVTGSGKSDQTLFVCGALTVPAGATATVDIEKLSIRSTESGRTYQDAGKFNIGEGGRLNIVRDLAAWSASGSDVTNSLVKQGLGEMHVYGNVGKHAPEAHPNANLTVNVEAGKLYLHGENDVKNYSVAGGAEFYLSGTIDADDSFNLADGATFGALGELTTHQTLDMSGKTLKIVLDPNNPNILKFASGADLNLDDANVEFELGSGVEIGDLLNQSLYMFEFGEGSNVTLPAEANGDWNYFLKPYADLDYYYNLPNPAETGGKIYFMTDASAVPEPATWVLLVLGCAGIVACRGRDRRH